MILIKDDNEKDDTQTDHNGVADMYYEMVGESGEFFSP